jgi:hypothetical protein
MTNDGADNVSVGVRVDEQAAHYAPVWRDPFVARLAVATRPFEVFVTGQNFGPILFSILAQERFSSYATILDRRHRMTALQLLVKKYSDGDIDYAAFRRTFVVEFASTRRPNPQAEIAVDLIESECADYAEGLLSEQTLKTNICALLPPQNTANVLRVRPVFQVGPILQIDPMPLVGSAGSFSTLQVVGRPPASIGIAPAQVF